MKTITSLVDVPLPMPDGRVLPAKGKLLAQDPVAASDRVQSWGLNVVIEDYEPPAVEEPDTKGEDAPKGRAKAADKAPAANAEKA
jgi:hypothetical protein